MKQILALLIVLTLVFSLAACNGRTDTAPTDDKAIEPHKTKRISAVTGVGNYDGEEYTAKLTLSYGKNGLLRCDIYQDGMLYRAETFSENLSMDLLKLVYDENGKERTISSTKYDENGNVIEKNSSMETSRYTYNQHGELSEVVYINRYNGYDDIVHRSFEYKYDRDGRVIEEHITSDNEGNSYISYQYDDNGRVIEINTLSDNGEHRYTSYQYDTNGNLIKETCEWVGVTSYTRTYKYDKNNNLLEEDTGEGRYYYQYDASGNMIEKRIGDSKTVYQYDEHGLLTTEIESYQDEEMTRQRYVYDKDGDLIQIITGADANTLTITISYENVRNFEYNNETLDDYVQYVINKMHEVF